MKCLLLLAALLAPIPALADGQLVPLPPPPTPEAIHAAWLQRLKAFAEATEKTTNRKLPPQWKQALTTGVWPWWGKGGPPDLTPVAPERPGKWWMEARPAWAKQPEPARVNLFVPNP